MSRIEYRKIARAGSFDDLRQPKQVGEVALSSRKRRPRAAEETVRTKHAIDLGDDRNDRYHKHERKVAENGVERFVAKGKRLRTADAERLIWMATSGARDFVLGHIESGDCGIGADHRNDVVHQPSIAASEVEHRHVLARFGL